jgi:hypothetical protein
LFLFLFFVSNDGSILLLSIRISPALPTEKAPSMDDYDLPPPLLPSRSHDDDSDDDDDDDEDRFCFQNKTPSTTVLVPAVATDPLFVLPTVTGTTMPVSFTSGPASIVTPASVFDESSFEKALLLIDTMNLKTNASEIDESTNSKSNNKPPSSPTPPNSPFSKSLPSADLIPGGFTKEKERELVERMLANPLDGDEAFNKRVRNCTMVSKGHQDATDRVLHRMWFAISLHQGLAFFADLIEDPELPNTQERRLFVYLRGVKTPCKLAVLNNVMIALARVLVKKKYKSTNLDTATDEVRANAQYEPNYVATMTRQLFSHFAKKSITYKERDFKETQHSFLAYWKTTFDDTSNQRPKYGRLPNQAIVDVTDCQKVRNSAKPPWDFDNFKDVTFIFVFQFLKVFMLRGQKEVSTCVLCLVSILFSN